jgi:hypothetical protein
MTKTLGALLFSLLTLSAAQAIAAPAPFARPAREGPLTVEQLKLILLRDHNIHADGIQAEENKPNSWLILGNSPMLNDGQMMYRQQVYRVTANGDRASAQLTVTDLTRSRYVITR